MSAHLQVDFQVPEVTGAGSRGKSVGEKQTSVRKSRKSSFVSMLAQSAEERAAVDQDLFLHMLSVERKRSERSGDPFMLVLLTSYEPLRGQDGEVSATQRGVFSAVRDTDVVGWFDQGTSLGIIFTEIADASQEAAVAVLRRMAKAIAKTVAPEVAATLEASCHVIRGGADGGEKFETLTIHPEQLQEPSDGQESKRKSPRREHAPSSPEPCASSAD